MFTCEVIGEYGYEQALLGMGLSFGITTDVHPGTKPQFAGWDIESAYRMPEVAEKKFWCDNGENKYLEFMVVYLDINAPRYWWQQMATYRAGVSTQSSSTMHLLMKQPLTQNDFALAINEQTLEHLNCLITEKRFAELKNELPEGYMQRRILCTNYKALRHIYKQRKNHRLAEWKAFCAALDEQLRYAKFFGDKPCN